MRRAALLVLTTGCFVRPEPRDRSGDGGGDGMADALVCPALGDDFEDPSGPPCGSWGAVSSTQPLERIGGALHTTVTAAAFAGCLGAALDLRNGVWLEIDTSQAGSDLTQFTLNFGVHFVEVDFDNNGTPTYQAKVSTGILATPSTRPPVSRPHEHVSLWDIAYLSLVRGF